MAWRHNDDEMIPYTVKDWDGMPVVCDRYVASTIAYQGAMDPELLDTDWKLRLVEPDATFYL